VVLTRAAQEFVGAITFEAVTGRRAYTEIFGAGNALDHIRLARDAEIIILAPATADLLARVAHGHADDLLTACLLAATCPVLAVPAMNDRMWANAQTERNVALLREAGYEILEPETGALAAGEGSGPGRMPEPETILAHAGRILDKDPALSGKKLVVTAGATREPIDPVRFISNHSSGLMGTALAGAAWRRGAQVTLVAGHLEVPEPVGPSVVYAPTTADMQAAVADALRDADALIMAAAPADFTPANPAARKLSKADSARSLELALAPDILATTTEGRGRAVVVGFALETGDAEVKGAAKLSSKNLDLIVVNDQSEAGAGFGVETNRVTLLGRDGRREELPLMLKSELADVLLDRVAGLIDGR
jgi:phosphopantothenoylcysteine decarboxylase/phosphopantothenate--cysteine ligase